jgi:hypothetical protein
MLRFATIVVLGFFSFSASIHAQGNALTLDGTNDYAVRAAVTTVTNNFTMEAWVKWDGVTSGSNEFIFYNGHTSLNGYGLFLNSGDSYRLSLLLGGNIVFNSTRSLTPNVWQHVAITRSLSGQWYLYIDGRKTDDEQNWYLASPNTPTDSTVVGANQVGGEIFGGQIDEFRFWKIARTADQILAGALSAVSKTDTNLVGYWRFDEAADTSAVDSTSNGFHLTLLNGATFTASSAMQLLSASNLQAVADTGQVKLTWIRGGGTAAKYYVFMDTLSDFSTQVLRDSTGGVADTTKTITSLSNFRTYYFRVAAASASGQLGGYSNEVSATPTIFKEYPINIDVSAYEDIATAWGDYDDDGDYDLLFVAGESHEYGVASIYQNNGGTFTPLSLGFDASSWAVSVAWCDYNNDGRLDVSYMGSTGNDTRIFKLYKNNGDGSFTEVDHEIEGFAKGWISWVDFDNDGDQDVAVMGARSGNGYARLYRNDGNGEFSEVDAGISGLERGTMSWADYDRDGDMDMLMVGSYNNNNSGRSVYLYRNDGYGGTAWSDETESALPGFEGVVAASSSFGDLNNDGWPDIVYTGGTGEGSSAMMIYLNNGNGTFTQQSNSLQGVTKGFVSLGDYDNDGDLDILVTGESGGGGTWLSYIANNDGEGNFTVLNSSTDPVAGEFRTNAAGGWNDFDWDGDLDFLVAGQSFDYDNIFKLYENKSSGAKNQPPSDPTGLAATVSQDTVRIRWNRSTDPETPSLGLTYNVRMGTAPAGINIMSPMAKVTGSANGGGFRYVFENGNASQDTTWTLYDLSDGTYYWSVEAIDHIYRNSKFQAEPAPFVINRTPTQVKALFTASRNGGAFVRWSAKNKSDVAKYYVQTDTTNTFDSFRARVDSTTGGINDTTITLTGLTNDLFYYVRVWAVDGIGQVGPYSDLANFIPAATPGKWFVTTTNSYGWGSLDSAVTNANASTQTDTIVFQIPAGSVIYNNDSLQLYTDYTYIDGDVDGNGTPDVTIDGNSQSYNGFDVYSNNNTIKNLVFSNCWTGIHIVGNNNRILGNYIGTDSTGNVAAPNYYGVYLSGETLTGNRIGDGTAAGRNIISGNGNSGITIYGSGGDIAIKKDDKEELKSSAASGNSEDLSAEIALEAVPEGNYILGNYIGVSLNGDTLGNASYGIYIEYSNRRNYVGDGTVGGRNIISGNSNDGVYIYNSNYNWILGNYIGTDVAGTAAIPNYSGIYFSYLSSRNYVGDGTVGGRNIISGNTSYGVGFGGGGSTHDNYILGNYIGTDVTGNAALGNGSDGVYFDDNYHFNNWIGNGVAGGGNTISANGNNGIYAYYSNNNRILGNMIGTNAAGNADLGNRYHGIYFDGEVYDNLIGNGTAAGRNVISGNDSIGIYIRYSGEDSIFGNYIGLNAAGTTAIPNDGGILIESSYQCAVGGSLPGQGNVVSGNLEYGIYIYGGGCEYECLIGKAKERLESKSVSTAVSESQSAQAPEGGYLLHSIRGNLIGTNSAGTADLGNGTDGIWMQTESVVVGDTVAGGRNVISGNGRHGVYVDAYSYSNSIVGNYIGTDINGNSAIPNDANGVMVWNASDNAIGLMLDYNSGGQEISRIVSKQESGSAAASESQTLGNSGNVIAGNGGDGIELCADTGMVWYTYVTNNNIGLGANGSTALPNGGDGLKLENISPDDSVEYTWIEDNTIAFNTGNGVHFTGAKTRDNQLFKNSIYSNTGAGIQISNGAQRGVGAPIIDSYDGTTVSGKAAPGALVQIFGDLDDEGMEFKDTVTADGSGNWSKTVLVMFGYNVTAIQDSSKNSSAFSNAVMAPPGTLSAVPTSLAFNPTKVADSTNLSVVLRAASGGVILSSAQIAAGTNFKFVSAVTTPDTLLAGDSLVVSVKFKPTVTGALSDTLVINNTSVSGQIRVALTGTGVENTPPTLTVGVLALSVVNKYLSVYVHSSEPLSSKTATFTFNGSPVANPPTLADVPGLQNVSYAQYKLTAAGTLGIAITATDTVGNVANANKTYTVSTLTKNEATTIAFEGFEATVPRGAVREDGFLIAGWSGDVNNESAASKSLGKNAASANERWMQVGRSLEIVSTVGFEKDVVVRLSYQPTDLEATQLRYTDFDERKVGLYRMENNEWIYEGGEGNSGSLAAKVRQSGNFALFYNPDHVFLPKEIELAQNYPNPFNPTTTIRFGLPDEGRIKLVVYNILGQKVTELINGVRGAGYHTIVWNGRNALGQQVATGVYIYRLETPAGIASRKMLLIK